MSGSSSDIVDQPMPRATVAASTSGWVAVLGGLAGAFSFMEENGLLGVRREGMDA